MATTPYRQELPALELSLERGTEHVPDDGAWYLLRAGQQIGRFRSLSAAREAWQDIVDESGWQPPPRDVDHKAALAREQKERWARNRAG